MQTKQLCRCRGNGKVFILFEASDLCNESTLSVTVDAVNGRSVPSAIYRYTDDPMVNNWYVVVVPMLTVSECVLHLLNTAVDGTVLSDNVHTLNFFAAKWESRFNYRLRANLSKQIRDYDETGKLSHVSLNVDDGIEDGDEVILRCTLQAPFREDNHLQVRCLLPDLSELQTKQIITDDSSAPLEFYPVERLRKISVSIRVPREFPRLVFLLDDLRHPSFSSFDVLDGPVFQDICRKTRQRLHPVSNKPDGYMKWTKEHFADRAAISKQRSVSFDNPPTFSIVVPLYRTPLSLFRQMIDSVRSQSYAGWELILVNASTDDVELNKAVASASQEDARIKVVTLERNLGISANTNRGIEEASYDFICFLDHDDTIEPDALFEYACAIEQHPEVDVLYSDEDKLSPEGAYINPFFKPDFSIDLIRNVNYICHFLAIRRSLAVTLDPSGPEVDGAQDHDITLKAIERSRYIHHVQRVLYHWRMAPGSTALNPDSKNYASDAGVRAVQAHLDRLGLKARVTSARLPFTYKVQYALPDPHPLVSIIIPNKDHTAVLRTCVESIFEKSTYDNFEVVILENGSVEDETFQYYESLLKDHPSTARIEVWSAEFNFSKLMNFGASKAKGDYFLLLNNDTEVITPAWIEEMLGICARTDVGAVGARLLYPDGTIQHAGVMVQGFGAAHLCKDYPRSDPGYFGLIDRTQDLSAVTAACLMTKRDVFNEVNGFSEEFAVAFNDIDFCLKVRETGKLVVYTPEAELFHHESVSRGYEDSPEKKIRFYREIALLNHRWVRYRIFGDPYINKNILIDNPYYQVWFE